MPPALIIIISLHSQTNIQTYKGWPNELHSTGLAPLYWCDMSCIFCSWGCLYWILAPEVVVSIYLRQCTSMSRSWHLPKMEERVLEGYLENVVLFVLQELHSYTYKELSSSIFQSVWVCESVSKASVTPDQISTFSIYKVINALHWPNNINYCLILTQYCQAQTIAVLYWPSTQIHCLVPHSWANWI